MIHSFLHFAAAFAVITTFISCGQQAASFSAADRDSLAKTHAVYTRMVSADPANIDFDAYVKGHYAEDAVILVPNGPNLKGHEEIIRFFKNAPFKFQKFDVRDSHIEGSGDMAFIQGQYDMTLNFNDTLTVNDKGNYLEIWKKNESGRWQCIRDISNSGSINN